MKNKYKMIIGIAGMLLIGACGYVSNEDIKSTNYADSLKDTVMSLTYDSDTTGMVYKDGVLVHLDSLNQGKCIK